MLRLYDVLDQFVMDNGPEWAEFYYSEVVENKLEDTVESVVNKNVSAPCFLLLP